MRTGIKLTQARLGDARSALIARGDRQLILWDRDVVGLGVRVTRTAMLAFLDYRDLSRVKRRFGIGRIPGDITITAARKRAAVIKLQVRAGGDPAADLRAKRAAATRLVTLRSVASRWTAVH